MTPHVSHQFGTVDDVQCCVRCFCESDWPLAETKCLGGTASDLSQRYIASFTSKPVPKKNPSRISASAPVCDPSPVPAWWNKYRLKAPRVRIGPVPPRIYTYAGHALSISQWSDVTGIQYITLARRISVLGWPLDVALKTPPHNRGRRMQVRERSAA